MKPRTIVNFMILISSLLMVGCQAQPKKAAASESAEIATLNKQIKGLYADSQYETPNANLNKPALTAVHGQIGKIKKSAAQLTAVQKKTLKSDQNQFTAATQMFFVKDTLNVELGDDQVLKDQKFHPRKLNDEYAYLQQHKPKFANTVKPQMERINNEVKAINLTEAATRQPNATKIAQARAAINQVDVKAFQDRYLAKIDLINQSSASNKN